MRSFLLPLLLLTMSLQLSAAPFSEFTTVNGNCYTLIKGLKERFQHLDYLNQYITQIEGQLRKGKAPLGTASQLEEFRAESFKVYEDLANLSTTCNTLGCDQKLLEQLK